MNENIIYQKLVEISQLKKFSGIQKNDFINKYFKQAPEKDIYELIKKLIAVKKIIQFKGKLYPDVWSPVYSQLEEKIIVLLVPYFKNGSTINLNYLIKEISFITRDSLDLLLTKLEYDHKIIKNNKYSYYSLQVYNQYLKMIKSLNHFTLSQFRDMSGLSRKESERFLTFLDRLQVTSFDGQTRTIKKS